VYRRAYALLVGIAVVMGSLAVIAAISVDKKLVDPEGFLGPSWLRLPLLLTGAFVQSAIDMWDVDYGYTVLFGIGGTFVIGIGSLAFGLVLMFVWYLFPRSKRFFRGESLNRDTQVMVPDEPATTIRSIDGGI